MTPLVPKSVILERSEGSRHRWWEPTCQKTRYVISERTLGRGNRLRVM
jgi:hypothetical protein